MHIQLMQSTGIWAVDNIQQTYTIRFRDDSQILKLFTSDTEKPEVINMNILFNSKKVKYENGMYIEEPEEDLNQAPRKSSIIISDKSNACIKYFKRPTLLSSFDFMPCAKQIHRVRVMNNKSQAKEKI